jgi:acetyl-CoA carboxylase/biotin carboxylase 1
MTGNSGARIGMAASLKSKFQVCWLDSQDPSKGFKYIYLTKDDYDQLLVAANGDMSQMPVICQELDSKEANEGNTSNTSNDPRYVITDIIGEEPDLGVENLMGSGLIAGETARAYNDIFTLTLVVGRTVGIGAYLVRLGQRTIQKTRHAPIILTGYQVSLVCACFYPLSRVFLSFCCFLGSQQVDGKRNLYH